MESERLRQVDDAYLTDLENAADADTSAVATFVGQTTRIATYPTTAHAFYAVTAVTVTGTETEGSAATLTVTDAASYELCYNLGTGIPPQGTAVECTFVPYQWVFQYDGPS